MLQQQSQIKESNEKLVAYEEELASVGREIKAALNKTKLLEGIPCGDQFPVCKFIRDANAASARLPLLHTEQNIKQDTCDKTQQNIDEMHPSDIESLIEDYDLLTIGRKEIDKNIESTKLLIERNDNAMDVLSLELENLDNKIQEYNDNIDVIENLEQLISRRDQKQSSLEHKQELLNNTKAETFEHFRQVGSLEERVESIKFAKQSYMQLRREYTAYDLFTRCMHSNGNLLLQ